VFAELICPLPSYVAGLLERGIRVLIYAGTYDWQCNWVSNVIWTEKLEWSGAAEYRAASWRDWNVQDGDSKAGETKTFGPFTFVTIRGAGHMVPYDKPVESLTMISRWLSGEDM
jgi:carboxypeptidase C (cathepsin A)